MTGLYDRDRPPGDHPHDHDHSHEHPHDHNQPPPGANWDRWSKERTFVRALKGTYGSLYEQLIDQPRVYKSRDTPWKGGPGLYGKHIISPQHAQVAQSIETHIEVYAPGAYGQKHGHLNSAIFYVLEGRGHDIHDGRRIAWKAGDVKWSPATGMHTSEVVSDAPVTIVEIEVKKPGDPSKNITTALDPLKVFPQVYKVEFENSQVRVVRVKFPAHGGTPMHEHQLNRVVVYLTNQNTRMTGIDGKEEVAVHKAGETSWGGATKHQEQNLMDSPFEALMVEFKN